MRDRMDDTGTRDQHQRSKSNKISQDFNFQKSSIKTPAGSFSWTFHSVRLRVQISKFRGRMHEMGGLVLNRSETATEPEK